VRHHIALRATALLIPLGLGGAYMNLSAQSISSPDAKLEAHKTTVLAFYEAAINKRDFAAASRFIGPRYIQHNPLIADGREGLKIFLDYLQGSFPNLRAEVKRVFAEGDFVIVHTHGVREPGQRGSAIVDIFKLEDGKIVEHWDVIQPIPDSALNPNGML
jgi:predicted SnoaL-like aldol condensation-catalyzing enzyme